MPISSLVIRTDAGCEESLVQAIGAIEGVTVGAVKPGAIVMVTETKSRREDPAIWERVSVLPGVLSIGLTYCNYEDILEGEP
jgi:nitrate reductase NapAB chaperone NapD